MRTEVTHVVYTRAGSGRRRVFLDGVEQAAGDIDGDFSNWDPTCRLGLANELTGGRAWLGELYLVAIYSRRLSEEEVGRNFEAGYAAAPTESVSSTFR